MAYNADFYIKFFETIPDLVVRNFCPARLRKLKNPRAHILRELREAKAKGH